MTICRESRVGSFLSVCNMSAHLFSQIKSWQDFDASQDKIHFNFAALVFISFRLHIKCMTPVLLDGSLRALTNGITASWRLGSSQEVERPLPPPMLRDNWENGNMCYRRDQFFGLAASNDGSFQWLDEGRRGRHKYGYIANATGAILTVKVPFAQCLQGSGDGTGTAVPESINTSPATGTINDTVVGIGMLRSYEHMGKAEVRHDPLLHSLRWLF